jgi:putative transposase
LKKALKPAKKRELVSYLTAQFAMSLRQACRILSLSRTVFRYQPDTQRDEPVIMALTVAAERYPDTDLKSFFRCCAGRAKAGTISAFTGFTAC